MNKKESWSKKNKERSRIHQARWYSKNKDKVIAARKARGPEYTRNMWLKYQYGIDLKEWNKLFDRQGRCCAICQSAAPDGNGRGWSTDHDHISGKIRGILCSSCNRGLGLLKDSKPLLLRAIEYLDKKVE